MSVTFGQIDGFIWMNGEMLPCAACNVPVLTHGLHYASCVFEGLRAYKGKIFKLEEHTERLISSGEILDLKIPFTADKINKACYDTLAFNNLKNAYIRPFAWRGGEEMGVSAKGTEINVAIATWQWKHYIKPKVQKKGMRLAIATYKRPSPETIPCDVKAAGLYMICTLSKHEAERKNYDDAMMLDYRGRVAEATGANLFFVKDGVIHTPTPDCFLDGITRQTVMQLAEDRGIEIIERAIMPEELEGFTECFMTGTAVEVTPVLEIGPYRFVPGQLSKDLSLAYEVLVGA